MFFLLRMAFWLTVVCVLLPGGKSNAPDAQIDPGQAVTLASAAMSDARGFCGRQPDACVAGGKVATAIGQKAEAGARTIYDFISDKMNEKQASKDQASKNNSAAKVTTASTAAKTPSAMPKGTLTSADMSPVWHEPVPLPPRRGNRPEA